jgi:hypothetical protein
MAEVLLSKASAITGSDRRETASEVSSDNGALSTVAET